MDEGRITEYDVYDFVRAFMLYSAKNLAKRLSSFQDILWHIFLYEVSENISPFCPLLKEVVGNFLSDTANKNIVNINFRPSRQKRAELLIETGWREVNKGQQISPPNPNIFQNIGRSKTGDFAKAEQLMAELGSVTVTDKFMELETDLMELIFRHAKRSDNLQGFVVACNEFCSCA